MSRRLVVEADGGSRGNPGVAGYGALVRDAETGRLLLERAEPLGRASNNVAEYSGLVAGLTHAEEIDPGADVEVRMDSKLVVEQMSGRWKIKHDDMVRLAAQAREIAGRIAAAGGRVRYTWVPRARNAAADALSNDAMDGRSITRRHADDATPEPETTSGPEPDSPSGAGSRAAGSLPRPARRTAPQLVPAARVVLVRHGATDGTNAGRLDGRDGPDPDLDARGTREAKAAAAGLRDFLGGDGGVRVVTSTLTRARTTGAVVASALRVPAVTDPAWDERGFGEWDGQDLAALTERHPERLSELRLDPALAAPDGESFDELAARVVAAFDAQVDAGGTSVVVTHRGPIVALLGHVLGMPYERTWRLAVAPASLTSVRAWSDGGLAVEFVNDTAHLRR